MEEDSATFFASVAVSRETQARLQIYANLLLSWQKVINLVSPTTLTTLWQRHFLDSAQLLPLLSKEGKLLDLGSGAGFPGLVLAIMTGRQTCLVEADQRKASFLQEVINRTNASANVIKSRIETLPPQAAEVVMARALAPLPKLLAFAAPHLNPTGTALFLKGAQWHKEYQQACKSWSMQLISRKSITSSEGTVLMIRNLCHA